MSTSLEIIQRKRLHILRKSFDRMCDSTDSFSDISLQKLRHRFAANASVLKDIPDFDKIVVSMASFMEEKGGKPRSLEERLDQGKAIHEAIFGPAPSPFKA